jgi:small subunit ribosomal protein S16
VAVKIKLKRLGKIRTPQYRIVIADSRTKRGGRSIEEIGVYHPTEEPSLIRIDSARALHWLAVGAQPTEAVMVLLKVTGDWQKFKGLPGTEGTLRVAEPKPNRLAVFAAAVTDAANEPEHKPKKLEPKEPVAEAVVEAVAVEAIAEVVAEEIVAEAVAEEIIAEEAVVAEAEEIVADAEKSEE